MNNRTLLSALVLITIIFSLPVCAYSSDWKLYGETNLFKAYLDNESIHSKNNSSTYDVWTKWELSKKGIIEMVPKKFQNKAKVLRMHWIVDCNENSTMELSNYLYDNNGNVILKNDNVNQMHEMEPGSLSEDFFNRVCKRNSKNNSKKNADDKYELMVQEAVGVFDEQMKEEGLDGVSTITQACYEKASNTKSDVLMFKCSVLDIAGMHVNSSAKRTLSVYIDNDFFVETTVKPRVKSNLSKVGMNLDDNQLKGLINLVSQAMVQASKSGGK